ncbi:unnamed protein product [Dicrocoelium dendriticum]|nr:unnamed protein product [Dicrocoelium dendriticum]
MQHSTTSSAPSSRTTGTGRSVIHPETLQHKSLSDACRQDTDFARRSMQSNIKSSSPTVFRSKDSFDNWSPRSTSPTDKLHLPLRPKTSASFRLPGVGDVCPVDSSSLSQDSATDSSDGDLPNVADVTHARLIDGGQPRSHKRRFYSRKHNFSIKDGQSHIQFPLTKRSVDCSSEEASVEDHKPPPPSVYLAINKNTHDSNARSITSVIDPIYRHGEYKHPFPVTLNKSPDRIQRPQRTTERRASTGTLDEHVEQFLEMLSKSYGLRASKVGKVRASLNQVLKMIPDAVPSADESSPALQKRDSHLSFIEMGDGVARSSSRSRSGELLSGRGAAHSYGDTFTNVSRPSPFDYDGGSCDHLDFTTTPQASRPGDRLPPQHHQTPVSSFHSRLVPAPFEPHDEPNEFCNLSTGPGNHRLDSDPRTSARATQREHRRSFKGRSQHEDGLPDQKYPVYQSGPHCFTYAPKSNPHLAPRGHSADPHRLRTEAVETVENGEDEDPGTETTALLDLTQELLGLRRGLKRTRQLNSGRLQTALKHISLLEMELQRQRCLTHDAQNACARQEERSRWEKHLASVLSELKQCQANIGTLQAQLDSWEADRTDFARSRFRLDNQQKELDRARSALGHQRKEISRLNSLLNHLLGVHPTDASPEDLQQLQTGLVELNRLVQVLRSDQSINSSQVRRAQSMQAGLTTGADPHAPSNPRYPPVIDVMRDFPGSLFCNVPEHHSIEDSLATARQRVHELKASQKDIQKKLRQASNVRSKLESQLEEQSAEINRLTTEVSVKQKKTCQSNADLSSLETSVRDRRDELNRLEEKIKLSETQLRTSEAQAVEVSAHRDRLNTERVQLTTELDALRLDAQRAKDQLGQAKDALQQAQCDVDSMTTMKQKFQLALTTLEQTVTTKEAELQSLSAQVTEVQNNLKRLGLEVDEGEHRIQSQRLLFSENETAVLKQQADLRRLAQQIEESQSRLIALAREAGEQRSQLDLIRLEKHREIGNSVSNSLELTTKTAAQQRELFETQSLLNSCLTEKAQVVTSIEALKAERDQLHSEIRQKQESLDEITSSLDQFKTELEDLADAKRSEETRLNDLFAQQRELVTQLDELRAQAREESERLRARDRITSQKSSEAESDRVELQRLATERKTVEAELSKLREDRDMIGSHLDRLKHKLDELERKEPVLIEAITKAKLELAQLRTNTQLESECLRQIQEDRATSQKEYDSLKRQLEEQRSEVECIQKRMHSVNLNHELSSFDMAIRAEGTIKRTAGVQCMTGEFVSQGTPALPDKARHGNIWQNETRSTELCHSESSHTELKGSLSLETDDHSMKAPRAAHSKTAAQHAPSEDKLDSGDVRSELARTKAALAVSQRSCKHLKRRAARELAELEQIAEDQCLRSAELTEQLALVKQQYAQLRRQLPAGYLPVDYWIVSHVSIQMRLSSTQVHYRLHALDYERCVLRSKLVNLFDYLCPFSATAVLSRIHAPHTNLNYITLIHSTSKHDSVHWLHQKKVEYTDLIASAGGLVVSTSPVSRTTSPYSLNLSLRSTTSGGGGGAKHFLVSTRADVLVHPMPSGL